MAAVEADSLEVALRQAVESVGEQGLVVVTGSLYVVGAGDLVVVTGSLYVVGAARSILRRAG